MGGAIFPAFWYHSTTGGRPSSNKGWGSEASFRDPRSPAPDPRRGSEAPMVRLFEAFRRAGHELYLVGGAVRDHLLGVALADLPDLDFATSALPAETSRVLRAARLPVFTVGSHFGTVGTILEGERRHEVQITTFRGEVYVNGSRKPRVTFGRTLEADLARRDFSINAMAMDEALRLIDPFGGERDLTQRVLRTVGEPQVVFGEDPLRMLRAARFIATLGMMPLAEVEAVTRERAADLLRVSRERWLLEMNRLLVGQNVDFALGFLVDTGLLRHLLPEVQAMVEFPAGQGRHHHKAVWPHTVAVMCESPARVAVRWAALLHDAGKVSTRSVDASGEVHFLGHESVGAALVEGVAERFRFDNDLRDRVKALVLLHQRPALYDGTWTDAAVRRFIRDAGPYLDDLLALSRADITSHRPGVREAALARNAELTVRVADLIAKDGEGPLLPTGIGHALMARFGIESGPEIGALKRRLEQAVLDGLLPRNAEPAEYLEYLDKTAR